MHRRKFQAVLRTHTFSLQKEPEQHFHSILLLYYPWRHEDELMGEDGTYESKFSEAIDVINANRQGYKKNVT